MKKTTKKAKKVETTPYKVSIKVLGKTIESTGNTVSEALSKFNERNVKGVRSIVIVEHDGIRKERILMPLQTNRFFNSHGLTKEIQLKNVSLLFSGL